MSTIGIYPGTFDPITKGHIDVIKKSLAIVNKLVIAVSNDYSKNYLFTADERVSLVKNSLFKDLKFKNSLLSDKIDLDYVEKLIREKFLFGKEGETLYIIKKNDN